MELAYWTQPALDDLDEIYDYIAIQDGRPEVAKSIYREICDHCDEYARQLRLGHLLATARPDLGKDCRIFAHKRWVIVFRPYRGTIEVLRVFDGSRDYGSLF